MTKNKPVLGFIGLGLMGVPMTSRLLAKGYEVHIWNRSQGKMQPLVEQGAQPRKSITELTRLVDVVMLCVSDSDAVEAVVRGCGGDNGCLLDGIRKEQIIVDFSSILPDVTRRLAADVAERGAHWADCPVSGGVAGAEQGTLSVMAGGDAGIINRLRPLLACLAQRVTHVGGTGSGQVTKICNQMLVSCNVLVMAEAMALAEKAGVDAGKIPEALAGGFADSKPLQLTGPRMAASDFDEVKWHVKTLLKDLDMANAFGKALGSAIPMAGLGAELMRLHGSQGYLENDPATLVAMYRSKAL